MQWIAMLAMLIDHIGIVFFPDSLWLRIIGRLALPVYVFGIVQGWRYTSNRKRYVKRLAVIFGAAQVPYMLYLGLNQINVVGTFLIVLLAFWIVDRVQVVWKVTGAFLAASVLLELLPFEYGSYILALALLYRYVSGWKLIAAHFALNVMAAVYHGWLLQIFSILPTLILAYGGTLNTVKVPRWIWISFYPAHLLFLFILK